MGVLEMGKNDCFFKQDTENINVKNKINKLGFVKIMDICSTKHVIKRVTRQATEWEKIILITIFN